MIALGRARKIYLVVSVIACALVASGCSNGRGSVEGEAQTNSNFTVGGAVSGLAGSGLVLQLNGAGDLTVSANGAFSFPGGLANGAAYDVTIRTQPSNPAQTCAVSSGAGRVNGGNVTNVAVACTTGSTSFTVGGSVTGLTGSGLILRNNGAEDLPIGADGEFIFPTPVATGASFEVTVATPPSNPTQTCTVENGRGVMGAGDVTAVNVICAVSSFRIGGVVSGLTGAGLQLQLNGAETLGVGADGAFAFQTRIASGASYDVSVSRPPTGQSCSLQNHQGTVSGADVSNVMVACTTNAYLVGGAVSGLAHGAAVTLRLQAGTITSDQTVRANGRFDFPASVPNGVGFSTSVVTQPTNPTQVCEISNGSGIVSGAPVTNIAVTCRTQRFNVGGTVQGLQGSGLALQLNGGNTLAISSNGSFIFDVPLDSGAAYAVTVSGQPATPPQTCTVQNGSGTIGAANVRNVRVTCALNSYSVGGSPPAGGVQGLAPGARVILQNNGGDPVEVAADGGFTFPGRITTGGSYNVTVRTQPTTPRQSCAVTNGTGTIGAANVTNVTVTCQSVYVVGGGVTGLAAPGLVLRLNGAHDVTMNADGAFTFPTTLTSGATYTVTIAAQGAAPSQTCTLANASGTIGNSDVTNVQVSCTTNTFTIGGTVTNLGGFGLQLQLNGGEIATISLPASTFTFNTVVPSGQAYSVAVVRQPDPFPFSAPQTCSVASGGSGTVGAANVTDVSIVCQ